MLAFYLGNKAFVLDQGVSIRITWVNPACYFDAIPGDAGMGIEIPANETNRALLGSPERFERYAVNGDREFEGFEVRYGGSLLLAGTLVIQNATAKSYSGWLRSNLGNMGKEHREKFIYDIPAFNQEVSFTNKANYDPLADPYGCPQVLNKEFFKDKGHKVILDRLIPNPDYYAGSGLPQQIWDEYETEALSEAFRKRAGWIVNALNTDGTVKAEESTSKLNEIDTLLAVNVVSPMLFLNFLIDKLLSDSKFFIDSNFIAENEDLKKLIVYNNFDITRVDMVPVSTTVIIPEPITGDTFNWSGPYQSYEYKIDAVWRDYTGKFKYKNLLPKVRLKDFILGTQNLLNVCFHFRADGKVDIIDREAILTGETIDIDKYMLGEWEIGEKKDVTLKFTFEHDSDDLIFAERWEDIDDRRPDEKEPVNDISELLLLENPELGEIRYIKNYNIYLQYGITEKVSIDPVTGNDVIEETLSWKHLALGFQHGFYNRGKDLEEEEIASKFSTIFNQNTVLEYPIIVQQPGNMSIMKYAYQSFSPRMFFYLGNNIGNFETNNLSLDWEKAGKGLLAKRWPKWARFWSQRQPVAVDADLPLNMLDYITRNITKKFRCEQGEFIIEEMETEFRLDSIGVTRIKGFKDTYAPKVVSLGDHWSPDNLILDETLIDMDEITGGFDDDNFGFDMW